MSGDGRRLGHARSRARASRRATAATWRHCKGSGAPRLPAPVKDGNSHKAQSFGAKLLEVVEVCVVVHVFLWSHSTIGEGGLTMLEPSWSCGGLAG